MTHGSALLQPKQYRLALPPDTHIQHGRLGQAVAHEVKPAELLPGQASKATGLPFDESAQKQTPGAGQEAAWLASLAFALQPLCWAEQAG